MPRLPLTSSLFYSLSSLSPLSRPSLIRPHALSSSKYFFSTQVNNQDLNMTAQTKATNTPTNTNEQPQQEQEEEYDDRNPATGENGGPKGPEPTRFEWMINKRPLVFSENQLITDYGKETAQQMIETMEKNNFSKFLGCLNWHGVGSRWELFYKWLLTQDSAFLKSSDPKTVFSAFAQYLGRVTSFRALSLTEAGYKAIIDNNSIFPSGRLKVDGETIDKFVLEYGVKNICYARLYIGLGLMPHDPSLSLHDDGETAVCIATTYIHRTKKIYLMKLSVPKIEVVGFKLSEVSGDKPKSHWFEHNQIWFDGDEERTERYTLYEIPFYDKRLEELQIFDTAKKINDYLTPFQALQLQKKNAQEQATINM